MIYKENYVYKYKNEKYRLIGSDSLNNNIFLLNISKNCTWNEVIRVEKFNAGLQNQDIIEIEDKDIMYIKLDEISEKSIEKMNFYYEIICYLIKISTCNEIYYSKTRNLVINKAMERYKVSYSTIKRIFFTYFKGGKIKGALAPKLYRCGGKGKEKNKVNNSVNVIIDESMKKVFKIGINKYFNTTHKNSKKLCYELIIRDFLKEKPYEKIPSLNQFYYWFNKLTSDNKKQEISKRYGDRIYQQKSRPIIGNSLSDTLAPADLYQIDSTILDVYIVSKLNRNLIVGRPVLYFVIDTYSRMIVGMNVTVEPFNSYIGVQEALINTMTDKVEYCEKFDVAISKDNWNVKCIPNRILADRGELLSDNILNAVENLGIQIQNTPPYRGDMKGIVEKAFERVHSYIKPFCDGVVDNKFNKVERGDEDYRLKANLTLDEITQIIIRYVLFHNNHHVLDNYESDGLDIESGVAKIPRNIWRYGVNNKKGLLRELDEETIKINLMNNKEVSVTAKGVKINKLYYVSSWTLEEGWYEKARINGSYKVRISYNPNDISYVYYIKEDKISVDRLELVTYMQQYKALGEEEYFKILEYSRNINEKAKEQELNEKLNLYNEIESITENARAVSKGSKDKNISKSNKLKNIRRNLEEERKLFRNKKNYVSVQQDNFDELDVFENAIGEWSEDYE